MKGGDLGSELAAHIDDQRHFVGAITVIVDQDVARQHPGERLHRQVAVDRLAAVELLLVGDRLGPGRAVDSEIRSEEHTSELQSLMRISYAVFCLKKKTSHNLHT